MGADQDAPQQFQQDDNDYMEERVAPPIKKHQRAMSSKKGNMEEEEKIDPAPLDEEEQKFVQCREVGRIGKIDT